jgi:(1->4)-alpha-D-glucan 1-alpha-D-glucosylmutase
VRRRHLDQLQRMTEQSDAAALASGVRALLDHQDGRAKLWITWRGLQLRSRLQALFRDGDYTALAVEGSRARHVIAFARRHEHARCVVVSGRLFALLSDTPGVLPDAHTWGDTTVALPDSDTRRYVDALTGREVTVHSGRIALADVLSHFPIAFLVPHEARLH